MSSPENLVYVLVYTFPITRTGDFNIKRYVLLSENFYYLFFFSKNSFV